jgi:alpha-beta hydrolase superfamily lysophospholipase
MEMKLSLKEKIAFRYIFSEERVYKRWYGRFFLFEMDFVRLNRVVSGIKSWLEWCEKWEKEGESVEKLADRELDSGNINTAKRLFHQATACYHIGQHFYFIDKNQKERVVQKARSAYRKAISLYHEYDRPIRIEIPYKGTVIPGYLFRAKERNKPLIIQTNGMDNIKEAENHFFAKHITPHGYNFFAFDGPGQGEMWSNAKFDVAEYPKVVSIVIDWFEKNYNDSINVNQLSLLGFSLGGFLAPYCAAFDKRVKCVIANSGWANIGGLDGIKRLKLHKKGVLYLTGCDNLEQAFKKFDLNITNAPSLECSLLYFHAGRDEIIKNPKEQADIVMKWAQGEKELRYYENAEHCTVDYLDEILPYMIDWLNKHLV